MATNHRGSPRKVGSCYGVALLSRLSDPSPVLWALQRYPSSLHSLREGPMAGEGSRSKDIVSEIHCYSLAVIMQTNTH